MKKHNFRGHIASATPNDLLMEPRPSWEAKRSPVGKELPCILWNPKIHYHIHKSPLPVSVLSKLDLLHTESHFWKIHWNIIVPSTSGFSHPSPSFRFPHQNPVCTSSLPHTCYITSPTSPSQSSWFDYPNNGFLSPRHGASSGCMRAVRGQSANIVRSRGLGSKRTILILFQG